MSSSFVKPGAYIDTLTSKALEDIKHLTNKDITVFCGGANDVSKNNSQEGLKHIVNYVKMNNHTNIILLSVPHRHDLSQWSCVNSEVIAFNRKLEKLMKPYKHVMVVKVELDGKFFTRHGLHMNNLDKGRIALKRANAVTTILQKQTEDPISLCWKNEPDDSVILLRKII